MPAAASMRGVGALSSAADVGGPLSFHLRSAGPPRQARPASRRSLPRPCRARVTAPSEGQRQQEPGQDGDPPRPIGSRRGRRPAPAPVTPQCDPGASLGALQAAEQEVEEQAPEEEPASASASASASLPSLDYSDPVAEGREADALPLSLDEADALPIEEADALHLDESDALHLDEVDALHLDEAASPGTQHSAEPHLSVASPEVDDISTEAVKPPSEAVTSAPHSWDAGMAAAAPRPADRWRGGGWDRDPEEKDLPGLVVCVGEPVVEFVPGVRPSERQAPHLVFAAWRSMQWVAPDFARAPGATSCQVALALGRMGVPVAFLGAVGEDHMGQLLRSSLEAERVRTDGLLVSPRVRTAVSDLRLPFAFHSPPPAQLLAEAAGLNAEEPPSEAGPAASPQEHGPPSSLASAGEEEAEDGVHESLLASFPTMLPLLHEATWVHCTSLPFTCDGETGALVERCLEAALGSASGPGSASEGGRDAGREGNGEGRVEGGGGRAKLFLDVNLPLLLWRNKAHAWGVLAPLWRRASVVELSRAEAEFLIGEEPYVRRRGARVQYAADSHAQLRAMHDDYHYNPQEVAPLWELGTAEGGALELLLITDGTVLVHYYTRDFDGSVDGTEDVLVAALTCDRSGSGDALVAGLIRKLVEEPGILQDQDRLERAIRFAISAGVISQWTTGAVRSFPTAEATQNLTEQMFLSTLV